MEVKMHWAKTGSPFHRSVHQISESGFTGFEDFQDFIAKK
jgi:hypothetical protein